MEFEFDRFTLAAATADLDEEPAARPYADLVEFRLDLATDPLDALAGYDGELPLLVTNRPAWEGGDATSEADRLDALETAVEHEAVVAVDLELAALAGDAATDAARIAAVRDHARAHDVAVVVSTHDFEGTPPESRLRDLLADAATAGDVGKLAVTASSRADALSLLSATHAATRDGQTVATMAMGEVGRHTRAVAPVYGSKIGYAPVDPDRATAPGQYDLATLAELVDELSGNSRI